MSLLQIGGVVGVAMMLVAYAGAQLDKLDPRSAPALLINIVGAGLVLLSMIEAFNLPAFLMESAWALVALYGLVRLLISRR